MTLITRPTIGENSSPKPKYNIGDTLIADGKDCTVVEVLEGSVYHVKNKDIPFDSFIIDLLLKEVQEPEFPKFNQKETVPLFLNKKEI
jgi:hypothetical protein